MKLVEILARELDEWPDGVEFLSQGDDEMVSGIIYRNNPSAYGGLKSLSGVMFPIAEDQSYAVVTKADWQAERAKLEGPDWSKAPEGATHWGPETDVYHECWYRKNKGAWECWPCNGVHEWLEASDVCCHEGLLQRPTQQWNGEGLPPVGEKVEMRFQSGKWYPVTPIAYGEKSVFFRDASGKERLEYISHFRARPILTHEQNKERESALKEIMDTTGACRNIAEELYSAGYRKQEASK